jgi:hypothetical protein
MDLSCSVGMTRWVRSALYAGSVEYPWRRTWQPPHSLQEEPLSILGSFMLTTLTSVCVF